VKARLFVPLLLVGVIVVGLVVVFASAMLTRQTGEDGCVSLSSTTPEQGPSAPDFFEKRGIHPPCMGQTSKLPAQAYTGNKP
jgi:hypothetical protein